MLYFQLFIDFGFLQSATKDCSLYRNDKIKLAQIVASTVQAKIILGLVGLVVIFSLVSYYEVFKGRETYIILAYIPVMLGIFTIDYLFRGLEIMKIITYRTIAGKMIYTVLIFILIHKPEQYLLIPVISAFGELLILIWTWYYIRENIGLRIKIMPLKETLLWLKESLMFFLSRIASTAYSSTNIVVLGFLYNNAMLAQFGVANALVTFIRSLFGPIADSLYPYMIQKKDYNLIKKILLILMPVITLGTVVLFFIAEPIILFMSGKDYLEAIPIFRAFLPVVVITLPVYLLGFPVLGAMYRMKEANLSVIYAAIYHIIGLALLFSSGKCTFISVAILTCTTEFFVLIYRLISLQKGVKQSY
jgi:PST family polysaccharide transporter